MKSNVALEMLDRLSPAELDALPIEVMLDLQAQIDTARAQLAERIERWWIQMDARFAQRAQHMRVDILKADTGTVHLPVTPEIEVEAVTSKRVTWDQTALRAALGKMSRERRAHYGKVEISVPEAKFQNAPPDEKAALAVARSVKPSKEAYRIKAL